MADVLKSDGWRDEDAAWERLQREIVAALLANDMPFVRRCIGQSLALAEAHFQTGDPRLAAAVACQARLLEDLQPALAASLFRDALAHWSQAVTWLAGQPPPRRMARSSSFHLRLESKHPGAYRDRQRQNLTALLVIGRTLTEGLQQGRTEPGTATYDQKRSSRAGDDVVARKVCAAVDLLKTLDSRQASVEEIATS